MVNFDMMTGQEKYKQTLKAHIPEAERLNLGFVDRAVRGGIAFGYAAAQAYQVYKDDFFLDYAMLGWNWGNQYTIQNKDLDAGVIAGKNFSLQSTCQEASMIGGTFWANTTNDTFIDSWTTGLSASLYKITANETYLLAALASASFIRSHMYVNESWIALNISGKLEDECQLDQTIAAKSTGVVVQGMSLLKTATSLIGYDELLNNTVVKAPSYPRWHSNGGILTVKDSSGMYLPRGLIQVYNTTSNLSLRKYISAYLSTQYNAVVDFAWGDGDIYSRSWIGPPPKSFDSTSQNGAISVLLAGILLSNESSNVNTIPNSSTTSKSPVGAIVGGTIGGLVFLLVAATCAFLCLSKHRRNKRGMNERTSGRHANFATGPETDEFISRQRIYRRPPSKTSTFVSQPPPDYEVEESPYSP
ncbi:glycoside hydrolase family 76 protein [Moniliophthora roreri]|nr:glycoside hydrolase family 76 protein [Moniliophthora roreri]